MHHLFYLFLVKNPYFMLIVALEYEPYEAQYLHISKWPLIQSMLCVVAGTSGTIPSDKS